MREQKYRNLYDSLLESDDLFIMYSGMSGVWEKDSKKFIKEQKELEDIVNFKDVDFDEEID